MHGKSKEVTTIATIKKGKDGLDIQAVFTINTDDFDIEIPNIVSKKVSKKVTIALDFILK